MTELRVVRGTTNLLGEGPCWDPISGRVWWFDILGRKIFWTTPDGSSHGEFDLPMQASVATPTADGDLLIVAEDGLSIFDRETGALSRVFASDLPDGFRTNDGKVDPAGALWWSSMDQQGGERPGAIYRYQRGANSQVIDGVHIANSMAFSPDGATFYLADSKLAKIDAFSIEPTTGRILGKRVFATFTDGVPDGATTDAEGYLWVAIWGGWRLERYRPDGQLDRVVKTPVEQPSCCIFGGPDRATLFVTSARIGLSAKKLAGQPLAGALFAFQPGVSGSAIPPLFC
jgi:sugar lactone lactonase YvrE